MARHQRNAGKCRYLLQRQVRLDDSTPSMKALVGHRPSPFFRFIRTSFSKCSKMHIQAKMTGVESGHDK